MHVAFHQVLEKVEKYHIRFLVDKNFNLIPEIIFV